MSKCNKCKKEIGRMESVLRCEDGEVCMPCVFDAVREYKFTPECVYYDIPFDGLVFNKVPMLRSFYSGNSRRFLYLGEL